MLKVFLVNKAAEHPQVIKQRLGARLLVPGSLLNHRHQHREHILSTCDVPVTREARGGTASQQSWEEDSSISLTDLHKVKWLVKRRVQD